MSTVAQLVDDIHAAPHPAPVLFLDTCAILDVIRAPRDDKVRHSVAAAATVLELAQQTPPAVRLVVSDLVPKEWEDNRASTRQDTNAAANTYERVITAATPVAARLGITADDPFPPLSHLPDVLEQLSRELLGVCAVLDRDPAFLQPAMNRVLAKQKQKNGIKDWYIFEHYLAVARGLTAQSYAPMLVFVSSNTVDFAVTESGKPHPDLAADFTTANLRYAVSLDSAVAQLRGNLQIP